MRQKAAGGKDIGFVGKVKSVNSDLIDTLLAKILFRLLRRSVWMKIIMHITLMQMMRPVQLQSALMQKNWHS